MRVCEYACVCVSMHACVWLSINIRQVVFLHTYTDTGLF